MSSSASGGRAALEALPHIALLALVLSSTGIRAQGPMQVELPWRPVPHLDAIRDFALATNPDRNSVVRYGGFRFTRKLPHMISEVWEWNGTRWLHRPATVKPPPRSNCAMAFDPVRRRVVMFGGTQNQGLTDATNFVLGDFWEWDGRTWREIRTTIKPSPRWGAAMITDPVRKKVVMFGGGAGFDLLGFPIPNDETWEWDGVQWRQIQTATRPWARAFPNMAYHPPTGKIVMMGNDFLENETWFYDGVNWFAQVLDPRPYTWGDSGMAYDASTGKLVFHGYQWIQGNATSKTWLWDGVGWKDATPANPPPISYGMHRLTDDPHSGGVLYVYATSYPQQAIPPSWRNGHETWRWRGAEAPAWKLVDAQECFAGEYSTSQGIFQAVHDPIRDEFVVVSRVDYPKEATRTVTWSDAVGPLTQNVDTTFPVRPGYVRAAHPGIQRVMAIETNGGPAIATRLWNGTTWERWNGGPTPPDANMGRSVYDSRRKTIVTIHTDGRVLEWDPSTGWHDRTSDPRPPKRGSMGSLAYDAARGRVVMFGGYEGNAQKYLDDTWEWDGSRWHQANPSVRPSPRTKHVMAYASWLGGVVLVAGEFAAPPKWIKNYYTDMWLWDGTQWARLGSGGFPFVSRSYPEYYLASGAVPTDLVADIGRERLRLFFGNSAGWDSLAWDLEPRPLSTDLVLPRPGEQVRFDIALPHDPSRPFAMLLSGAAGPGIPLFDTGGLGPRRLPLGWDPLLAASLQLGLVQTLDAQGRGAWTLPIPQDLGLVGTRIHAAGLTLAPGPAFGSITNRVQLDIVR